MASGATITVSEKLRPALYKYAGFYGVPQTDGTQRVLMHTINADGGFVIELEDGSLARADANQVWLLDSENLFAEYDWDGMLKHLGVKE